MPENVILREFEYRPNRIALLVLFALACGGEGLFCYFAIYADRGVNVNGLQLTRHQFRVSMGALAVISSVGLIALALSLKLSFIRIGRIAFTEKSIIVPKLGRLGIPSGEIEISCDEIISVSRQPFMGQTEALRIESDHGTVFLPSNMLPSREAFEASSVLLQAAFCDRAITSAALSESLISTTDQAQAVNHEVHTPNKL